MRFPRHEYWSGLPFPPPGDLPDPGMLINFSWSLAPSLSEFVTVTRHGSSVEAAPLDILYFVFSSLMTAPYDSTVFSSCDLRIGNMAERVKWINSVLSLLGVNPLWH